MTLLGEMKVQYVCYMSFMNHLTKIILFLLICFGGTISGNTPIFWQIIDKILVITIGYFNINRIPAVQTNPNKTDLCINGFTRDSWMCTIEPAF